MTETGILDGVWADLIGQEKAVSQLKSAIDSGMSHSWLICGPAGSGRSVAAKAFAAALQCENGGCGHCNACQTALSGSHPDVTLVTTEKLSIGIDEIRSLVLTAVMAPSRGRYQVIIVEDADRITVQGANALLKSIEEPAPKTVWILCVPNPEDVLMTIRSRCRQVNLVTPSDEAVERLLIHRDGIDPQMAHVMARVAQGHIGRARRLSLDASERARRDAIIAIPGRLRSISACLECASELITAATDEADQLSAELDQAEIDHLKSVLGLDGKGTVRRGRELAKNQAALKALQEEQKIRHKRFQRDALDRVLVELSTWYRDIMAIQLGVPGDKVINVDKYDELARQADRATPQQSLRRISAVIQARTQLGLNVSPQLAIEDLLVQLGSTQGS